MARKKKDSSESQSSQVAEQPKTKKISKKKKIKNQTKKPAKIQKKKPKVKQDDQKADYLPGQRYPTPIDDAAYAFYKSLYEKNPNSQMAKKYCLEYGVLEKTEAAALFKKMKKK